MENDIVRTRVTLASGAVTPEAIVKLAIQAYYIPSGEHKATLTSKETPDTFRLIGLSNAVEEPIVGVGLQSGLDAVEGEGGYGRQDAGGTGRDLGSVTLHPPPGLLTSGTELRHGPSPNWRWRRRTGDILDAGPGWHCSRGAGRQQKRKRLLLYCGKASDSGLIKRTRVISAVAIQWNRLLATGNVPSRPLMVSIREIWGGGRRRCGVLGTGRGWNWIL